MDQEQEVNNCENCGKPIPNAAPEDTWCQRCYEVFQEHEASQAAFQAAMRQDAYGDPHN